MSILTRLAMALSFFVMSSSYANSAGNSVYVEQIGGGSTINVTQTGNSNAVGSSATRAIFNGNNNNVTIEQIGNSNITNVNIQGDGVTTSSLVSGNSNNVDINCVGTCSSSVINNTITGNGNSVTQDTDGLTTSNVTINSDNNTVTINNDSTAISGAKSTVDISGGNGNNVTIAQTGAAGVNGHEADLTIVGATNNATIKQGGSVDSKVVGTINGSGNNVTIKSNHP